MVASVALLASSLAAVYSTSLVYAGFLGLAALLVSSHIGHGGSRGYGGYGGNGGYGEYGGYGGHGGLGGHGGVHGHGENDKKIGAHFKIGKYKLKKGKKVGGKFIAGSIGGHLGKQKSGHKSKHIEGHKEGYKCEHDGGYRRSSYGKGCNEGNIYGAGHSVYGRRNSEFGPPLWDSLLRDYIKKTEYGNADDFENKKIIPSSGTDFKGGLPLNSVSELPESPNGFMPHALENRATSPRSHFVASVVDMTDQDERDTEYHGKPLHVSKPAEIASQRVGVNRKGQVPSGSSSDSESSWLSMKEPEEERLLRSIRETDTNNCGLRLVCELAAIRNRPLTREEWEILNFVSYGDEFYDRVYPGEGLRPDSTALLDYQEAAYFGKWGGACAERFRRCPVDAHVMMDSIMDLLPKVQNF